MLEILPTKKNPGSGAKALSTSLLALSVVAFSGAVLWAVKGVDLEKQTSRASVGQVPTVTLACQSEVLASETEKTLWQITVTTTVENAVEGQVVTTIEGKGSPADPELATLAQKYAVRNGVGVYSRSTSLLHLEDRFLVGPELDPNYEFTATTSHGGVAKCQGTVGTEGAQ